MSKHNFIMKTTALAFLLILAAGAPLPGKTVKASGFGAVPDDGADDSKALRQAAEYCRTHMGTTLVIEPGTYILSDPEAIRLERKVLAGEYGPDPEKAIFTPYFPYVRGLDFEGSMNVSVMAEGVTLMCDGWMEPVSITGCRNFRLTGLTIDYVRKPFSQGEIVGIGENHIDVRYSPDQVITESAPVPRLELKDPMTDGIFREPFYFPASRKISDNTFQYSVNQQLPERLLGSSVAALHSFHFRPAILIRNSVNTILSGVTIHSQPGMGIVGFDSKDIFIDGLEVSPSQGYDFSTNTDATHFACCRGKLTIRNSTFVRQGDDATNVHGYYHNLESLGDGWYLQVLEAPTYTHAQVADIPEIGDLMEICSSTTLEVVMTVIVAEVSHEGTDKNVKVRYDRPLPDEVSGLYAFNVSKLPSLKFCSNKVFGNLARGVLVKTRDVLIRGNEFRGCTGTAVHVGAESGWREGTYSKKVIIDNNLMVDCGFGAGCQKGASGIAVLVDAPDPGDRMLHDGITITGNRIDGGSDGERPCGIFIRNSGNVVIKNNTTSSCRTAVDSLNISCSAIRTPSENHLTF